MEHTKYCTASKERNETNRAAFIALWPNYCQTCFAAGWHWYDYDPSPAGVGLGPGYMTDCEDCCPECVGKGNCPRCGQPTINEEGTECSACGWKYDEDLDVLGRPNFIPEPYECDCFETMEYKP